MIVKVAIIGAGPTGLVAGIGLARRGHEVVAVDRDAGPPAGGRWDRRGVMQFHHAHAFRAQVGQTLRDVAPGAWDAWLAAGAEPVTMTLPDGTEVLGGMRSRRETFERAVRSTAAHQPGLTLATGHVDGVTTRCGRVGGLSVDGHDVPADLVIDASGRSGRVNRHLRAPGIGGECGIAYVDRQYRLRPGQQPPLTNPVAWQGSYDGFGVLVFLHEQGIFSALIIRNTSDRSLLDLRHGAAFEAAAAAVPGLAAWTDPSVAVPLTDVLPGGPLLNVYRGQRGPDGRPALPGLVFVGDSVCTTTPNFGRGITTSLLQVAELLRLVDEHGTDLEAVACGLDAFGEERMRPWVEDHVQMDSAQARRWAGDDVDLSGPLPSDVIMMAADRDPSIGEAIGPYAAMAALPASLRVAEDRARAVYATGWRHPFDPGPTRGELAEVVARAVPAVAR
ncbi:FAD-dependent oxidoreductase [Intrasporangium flavum]|uniref:FAD-dependent oxidoreductase n=1 Tax=Intrasporangium flavum TaxID=1428657 RepID=UPI0009F869C0|nr:FAD-dependent oxidoreductase [Intrasporangium flavum]